MSNKEFQNAAAKVQAAADCWNAGHPDCHRPMRIAWGYASKEEETEEQQFPDPFRQHEGLMDFGGRYYQIHLVQSGDPDDHPDTCHISTDLLAEDDPEEYAPPCRCKT